MAEPSAKPVVLFRADAHPQLGTGHVTRCLTLAQSLERHGAVCHFLTAPESCLCAPRLARSGVPVHTALSADLVDGGYTAAMGHQLGASLLIIDHYGLGPEYEMAARPGFRHMAVIDDLPRPHVCDVLLDQTAGRTPDDWSSLLPPGAHMLMGSTYALLRPEFAEARAEALIRHSTPHLSHVLVSLGGTDPDGGTLAVLDGIDRSGLGCTVDVVMGAGAVHLDAVRHAAHADSNITLHVDVEHMAPLMVQADIAIGGGGGTTWERCCLGLPTLLVGNIANQRDIMAMLIAHGAASGIEQSGQLDGHATPDPQHVATALLRLAANPNRLTAMASAAQSLCDGLGAGRVTQALLSLETLP